MYKTLGTTSLIALAILTTTVLTTPPTFGQDGPAKNNPAKKKQATTPPAFQPPAKIDPTLPNVLLIGDSISMGYMLPVRAQLDGIANVYRPATNCGPTTRGLQHLDDWLGDTKWDVIHFNFGLHDLKYVGPTGDKLSDPKDKTSRVQVPIDQYAANLKKIAVRLKQTGAMVIWRETTPVPDGSSGRIAGDAARYNEAASKVMAELGIETDPLYTYAIKHSNLQRKKNVHYTDEGSQKLAEQISHTIRAALKN